MKVLVAQTISLGDIVLATPLLQHLKSSDPSMQISALVQRGMEGVLVGHPAVSEVLTYDKNGSDWGMWGVLGVARRLARGRFDSAIVLPGSVSTALAVYLAGIRRRIGTNMSSGILLFAEQVRYKRELKNSPHAKGVLFMERLWKTLGGRHSFVSPLFTDVVILDPARDAVQRHLQLLQPLNIPVDSKLVRARLYPSSEDAEVAARLLSPLEGRTIVGMGPGSQWMTKRWPITSFASTASELVRQGYGVIQLGGPDDEGLSAQIQEVVGSRQLINCCGRLTILQSAAALKNCRVLLTNDSAPMHLAASMGTPCISLFGPTSPEFGFAPSGSGHKILQHYGLPCRPCTPHGGDRCPISTHECMTRISVEEVVQALMEILQA